MKYARVEILVEELSMQLFLNDLLPFILPDGYELGVNVFLRSHEGKSDLKKGLAKWVRLFDRFHEPGAIIVIHDQDAADCRELKENLRAVCNENGNCPVLIRIACRELENWYLGDLDALHGVYPVFNPATLRNRARYRSPDNTYGAVECERIIPTFKKTEAAQEIVLYMVDRLTANRSESFQQTISGIRNFLSIEEE